MKNKKRVELLAPAGNTQAFYGAVNAGADAVYLAGNRFGARAYAENFTTEELVECIRYAHLFNRKVYLTVNTLVKESELEELFDYIQPFYQAGLDGVIVQDFGVFRHLRRHFPDMELHASTQMTLCGSYGAQLLKDMGATRIVPARELSLEEIRSIKSGVDIEIETFIHGAMCYCYSGQCLFSSILGGRSGNRGRCAQPCRLPYAVKTDGKRSKEAYYLSLKDMCTVEHIPELIEAGIDSFKIEGRMKRPEYAAGVTAIYRKYIDKYYALAEKYGANGARERFFVEKEDKLNLSSLYIRSEIQDGYYFKHNGKEMVTLSSPAYSGSEDKLLERIQGQFLTERKKLPIQMEASFCEGAKALLTLYCDEEYVTVEGELVETANRQPITEENVTKQLGKLGDSVFCAEKMSVYISETAFYPLKQINELRRQAVKELEEKLLIGGGCHQRHIEAEHTQENIVIKKAANLSGNSGFSVSLETTEQLLMLSEWVRKHSHMYPQRIYVAGDLLFEENVMKLCTELAQVCKIFITLPYILRDSDKKYLEELYSYTADNSVFAGFLIRSLEGLGFLRHKKKNGSRHLDANVYAWNHEAVEEFSTDIDVFCLPYELKASEQRQLLKTGVGFEKVVYGRIPMMITANCVLKTSDKCSKNSGAKTLLIDRYEKEFPVARNCRHCTNIIYNSVPLSLHQEYTKWQEAVGMRIDFTVETGAEAKDILDAFLLKAAAFPTQYTTGHEKRGVE